MPFGVANAQALFQEPMNKILYILRRRPLVEELISRGAEMASVWVPIPKSTIPFSSMNLSLFVRKTISEINLDKCEFIKEEMEYLGFDVGYGWWKPAASKMQPLAGHADSR